MTEDKQDWILVCVRRPEQIDGCKTSFAPLPMTIGEVVRVHDVHPLDVDAFLDGKNDDIIVTMSVPIIDAFAAYGVNDARRRLWFIGEDEKLRQMTTEQAEAFYRAWETGVQHVSEILLSEGLWQ